MGFPVEPLRVTCNLCGVWGETYDSQHPDLAVQCDCCPVKHDHAGLGCRTVTIQATAYLTFLSAEDLLDAIGEFRQDDPETILASRV